MRAIAYRNRVLLFLVAVILILSLLNVWSGSPAPSSQSPIIQAATIVASSFNYQGRITDTAGAPLDGSFSMRFFLYDQLATEHFSGTVVRRPSPSRRPLQRRSAVSQTSSRTGSLHEYRVEGVDLTPRRQILPAPYALSLRPAPQSPANRKSQQSLVRVDCRAHIPRRRRCSPPSRPEAPSRPVDRATASTVTRRTDTGYMDATSARGRRPAMADISPAARDRRVWRSHRRSHLVKSICAGPLW